MEGEPERPHLMFFILVGDEQERSHPMPFASRYKPRALRLQEVFWTHARFLEGLRSYARKPADKGRGSGIGPTADPSLTKKHPKIPRRFRWIFWIILYLKYFKKYF